MKNLSLVTLLFLLTITVKLQAQKTNLTDYNIKWSTIGINSQGSMPIGNGDIGANIWVEENGDFVFYISKTDAWSEIGRILKLGKVRVKITPNPFKKELFLQELKLEQGEIYVNYGQAKIKFWIDANNPVIQIDVESKTPVNVMVSYESWRKERRQILGEEGFSVWGFGESGGYTKDCLADIFQEPDTILPNNKNQIISYHHNKYSIWKDNLKLQALDEFALNNPDPLLNLTYGTMIEAEGLVNKSDTLLESNNAARHFQINIYPLTQKGTVNSWKNTLLENAADIKKIPTNNRKNAHYKWWQQFWDRNYIYITAKDADENKQAEIVTQGYILQRFINASGGRGNSPVKFNGSIFTVDTYNRNDDLKGLDADFRRWGGCYWWQNTRLPYWSMLFSGDFDMMKPLFSMYLSNLPLRKLATKKYYHHDGAFFPETMNFWGTYADGDYGCERKGLADGYTSNPYIRYYWQSGLELSLMMLDYYSFTNSINFASDTLVPMVSEILTFFDQHWQRGSNGKILFSPAMSLETFHTAVNPLPEIVGIRKVAEKMIALPKTVVSETQCQQWKKLINDLPEIPTMSINNKETVLAPAAEFSNKANVENPELYAIFPYRTFGIGKPDIELAQRTFSIRTQKENLGWQQNSIQAAYLGLTDEAKRMVIESFSTWDKNFRFPAFWGPNYDWTPDQCHGNVAMIALQRMVFQYENNEMFMLPAWPEEWDVNFKLHAPKNTTLECEYRNGKITKLKVTPESRRADISFPMLNK